MCLNKKIFFLLFFSLSFSNIFSGTPYTRICELDQKISQATNKFPYYVDGKKYKINVSLIKAIIHQETGGNPKAVSPVGARGLMQLMPQTAELLKCDYSDIFNSDINIHCGTKFLAALLTYTKGDLIRTISGYNGGSHSTEKSLLFGGRIADNPETKNYVKNVLLLFEKYKNKNTCQPK